MNLKISVDRVQRILFATSFISVAKFTGLLVDAKIPTDHFKLKEFVNFQIGSTKIGGRLKVFKVFKI